MEVKNFDDIYLDMVTYLAAHQDNITDFNEGGVATSILEAFARDVSLLYIRARVGYGTYIRGLPYSIFDFRRKTGSKASTTVVFSRSEAVSFDSIIPVGTVVSTGDFKFITTELGRIDSGTLQSNTVGAAAENLGTAYNVDAGAINTIVSMLSGDIVDVQNTISAAGGQDNETFHAYMIRFSEYILGLQRTNKYGLRTAILKSGLVRSLSIQEHFPPAGIYNATIYIEDGSGGATPNTISAIYAIIDGDGSEENGGYRAPGVNIRIQAPVKVPITVHIEVTTRLVDNEIAKSEIEDKIRTFINSLEVGKNCVLSDLALIVKRIPYVTDLRIISPSDNVSIQLSHIARYQGSTITIT